MAEVGLKLIEACALYNMLQQGISCSRLADPNYLLLLDARIRNEYNYDHVITAKKAPKTEQGYFTVPYDAELECKQNIIIYDNTTTSISNTEAPAVKCGRVLWNMGSKYHVRILKGGYEEFSALYPFLRTQKIIYMPRELDEIKPYPVEIVNGFLYLGTWSQAHDTRVQKDLKIKALINVCEAEEACFKEDGNDHPLMHIAVKDDNAAELYCHFDPAYTFIDKQRHFKLPVLVFSDLGMSRSATVVMAYLMKRNTWPLELAYQHVGRCQIALRPNRAFIEQLSTWEERLFGARSTNVADPFF